MARAIYSEQLVYTVGTYGSSEFAFDPVPDGVVWIVRDIQVQVSRGVGNTTFGLFDPFAPPGSRLFGFIAVSTQGATRLRQWQGRIVLKPGQQLGVQNFNDAGDMETQLMVCGYVLTSP